MEREINISFEKEKKILDPDFRPNPVHLTIMKEAKKNSGIYDRQLAIQRIKESSNEEKLKKQMIVWNQTNLTTLVNAGYMIRQEDGLYLANTMAYEIRKNEFIPGQNHKNLMSKNVDGVISNMQLAKEFADRNPDEQKKKKTFNRGMLKNLNDNGYIERIDKGKYKITEKGYLFLEKPLPAKRDTKVMEDPKGFKVTSFDKCINDVVKDKKLCQELIDSHKRKDTILKRIETFKKNGLILEDGTVTDKCLELLEKALELSKDNLLTIEKLTQEQLQLVKDMRIFLNLTEKQIVEFVYKGNKELAETDLNFFIRKKIIKKDDDFGVYIMDKIGIALSNELYPDAVKYHTKLHSRKEELEHDMLVYTAYQNWIKDIVAKGGKIIEIKNDRQLRSDDAKKYGHMVGAYPDLRVFYKMPTSDKIKQYDIEMDCGYDGKTIKSKMHGLTGVVANANLGWYCKTAYQAAKVAKIVSQDTEKASRMNVARKLTVFYLDRNGKLQTVKHRHWDG